MATQRVIAREISRSYVGRTLKVLVEGPANPTRLRSAFSSREHGLTRDPQSARSMSGTGVFCIARGEADAPDIDGRIYVRGKLPAGEFARVKIVDHTDYDLIAE